MNINPLFEILENDRGMANAERKNARVTSWVGTWNNPKMTDEQFKAVLEDLLDNDELQYAIFQREVGEECATPHFQFFVNFKGAKQFSWVKKTLPYGCHFKPMITTKRFCKNYCSKPDGRISGPYEVGEFIEERGRSDLAQITDHINEGMTLDEIAQNYPSQYIMYSRQIKELYQRTLTKKFRAKFRKMTVNYIHGKTDTGKTKFLADKYGYENFCRVKFYDSRAFDKYENERVLVLDEYRTSFKITDMLHFLDGHPLDLPCRYADKTACYDTVYIITNLPLTDQHRDTQTAEPSTWQALMRRIHNVYDFDNTDDRQKLFDETPNPNKLYNGNKPKPQICEQTGMRILTEEESWDMPF